MAKLDAVEDEPSLFYKHRELDPEVNWHPMHLTQQNSMLGGTYLNDIQIWNATVLEESFTTFQTIVWLMSFTSICGNDKSINEKKK